MASIKKSYSNYTAIVLGVGRMGQRYLTILSNLNIKVVAICDQNSDSLAKAAKITPEAKKFRDPEALFREVSAPLVIIATTAASHAALTILAVQNDAKYVVCEKPMAVSIEQTQQMLNHCEKQGAKLAINHQMRFMPQYTKVKTIVTSEGFAGLCSMTIVAGNFGLTMNGSHYIEALRYLSDSEPESVSAWLEETGVSNPRGDQFVDKAGTIRVVSDSGVRLYLDCSAQQGHGMQAVYAGGMGQLCVDEAHGRLYGVLRKPEDRNMPKSRVVSDPIVIKDTLQAAEVLDSTAEVIMALLDGRPVCDGRQGQTIIKTLVAAYVSNEEGHREVLISESLPTTRIFPWA